MVWCLNGFTLTLKENLSQLVNLERLVLNHNNIEEFNASAFTQLHQLRFLDLSNNHLEAFSGDFKNSLPR